MVQNAFSGYIKELLIKIEKMETKYKLDILESETKYKLDLMEYKMKIVKLEHNNIILGNEIETNNKIFQLEKKIYNK